MVTFVIVAVVFVVATFCLARANIWFADQPSRQPRFGDPGIGQRDDYDSDIRSPEITAMRDKQRADDVAKAMKIMRSAGLE